ncbi:hypothetical protein C8E97_6051 [Saccharothrix australiensis]|uniref:Uncharacterized protein n=1 Tax=Saccharothrix australiensis TaxID=2072 RepID=A0A495W6N8_9PSEU|nr:hypothetical protein C8E97_6051 [Saccharothrix australiensis]
MVPGRGGSGSAFDVCSTGTPKAVYNHCFRLTASWAAAEDHLQNTFPVAWRKRARRAVQAMRLGEDRPSVASRVPVIRASYRGIHGGRP